MAATSSTRAATRTISTFVLEEGDQTLKPEDLTIDQPRPTEVSVEVAACGVCHTDLHVIKNEVAFPRPAVLGHEISGIVRAVGDHVDHVSPGDRVVCSFIMPCGECRQCSIRVEELCETFFSRNRLQGRLLDGTTRLHRQNGEEVAMYSMSGHATDAIVPATAVFPIGESVPLQDAAILGCSILTAYGAVHEVARLQPGQTVAVIAAGGIGLSIIHLAKAAGANEIIAIDIDDEKLRLAADLGASMTLNSTRLDPLNELTSRLGRGVDVVFEALGSTPTAQLALDLVDDGGRVVLAGIAPAGHTLGTEITKIVRRKIQILGSFGAHPRQTMPNVISLAEEGLIDLKSLITHRFAFDELPQAYTQLDEGRIRGRGIVRVSNQL